MKAYFDEHGAIVVKAENIAESMAMEAADSKSPGGSCVVLDFGDKKVMTTQENTINWRTMDELEQRVRYLKRGKDSL